MADAGKKLIAVFGATGQQGNGVARALLEKKGYQVRALTRNTDSPKAKALQAAGASTQKVDLDDLTSIESAIQGAYGVFAMTNYWGLFGENPATAFDREVAQGKAIGDTCKKLGVKLLAFSGGPDPEPLIGKKIPNVHSKVLIEKYFDKIGVAYTSARFATYHQNYLSMPSFQPQKTGDGTYAITFPISGYYTTISVEDGGRAIAAMFDNPDKYAGNVIDLFAEKITMKEVVKILTEVTGKTIKYNQLTTSEFAQLPFPGAQDLADTYEFVNRLDYDQLDPEPARKLNPNMQNFKSWAENNRDAIIGIL